MMLRTLLTGITLAFAISAAHAANSLQLTCSGEMIEPAGLSQAPKALTAIFSPANGVSKVSVDFGQGSVNAPVLSNNQVQLPVSHQGFHRRIFLLHSRYVSYL
jgi:hypothetical protein